MLKNVAQGLPFIFFPANTIKSKEVSAISTTAVPTNTISTTAVPTNTISTNAVPENTINTTAVPANTISTTAVPANTISTSLVYANTMRITAVPENAIKTTSVPVNTTESSTTTTTTETAFPKTTTVTITKSTFATTAQTTSVTERLKNNIEFKIQESTPLPILPLGTTLKTTTSITTEATTPTPLGITNIMYNYNVWIERRYFSKVFKIQRNFRFVFSEIGHCVSCYLYWIICLGTEMNLFTPRIFNF